MGNLDRFSSAAIDLLRYYKSGNNTSMKKIFDKAQLFSGWDIGDSPFWYANVQLALELAGIVEVVETSNMQNWSFVSEESLIVKDKDVIVLGEKQYLKNKYNCETTPRISTGEGFLIYSCACNTINLGSQVRKFDILHMLPSIGQVENDTLIPVAGTPDFETGEWLKFDFTDLKWKDFEPTEAGIGIYRSIENKTGKSFWIYFGSQKSFRVIYPEWGFLLYSVKAGVRWDSIINYQDGKVVVPRQFRLPRLLLKELFLISDSVHIDWEIAFEGVSESDFKYFIAILKKKAYL